MIGKNRSLSGKPVPGLIFAWLLIILLGFFFRVRDLGGDSLWLDEILTVRFSSDSLLSVLQDDVHPPLFYVFTRLGISLFGDSEFAIRTVSLFAGTITISLIIALGQAIKHKVAGLWAAFILALSAAHIRYSQDGRQYAMLVALTVLSYLLLYKALVKPKLSTWLAYAVVMTLGLYTHYGALIVLFAQVLLIAGWFLSINQKIHSRLWFYPVAAALVVVLLFSAQLRHLRSALQSNIGADLVTDTGTRASLEQWFNSVLTPFGGYLGWLPTIFFILAMLGMLLLVIQHDWYPMALLTCGFILPIPIIYITQVARDPAFRYVLFILPFYLFAVGIAISYILRTIGKAQFITPFNVIVSLSIAVVLLLVSWPAISYEHKIIEEDWKGILKYLDSHAKNDDTIISLNLTAAKDVNLIGMAMPYYLNKTGNPHKLLNNERLSLEDAQSIKGSENSAWAIVRSHSRPIQFEDDSLIVSSFSEYLYVINDKEDKGSTLKKVINLYEKTLPFALLPEPHCYISRDLALLYFTAQEYDKAFNSIEGAVEQCPPISLDPIRHEILSGLLKQYSPRYRDERAIQIAYKILEFDPKNDVASDFVTAVNLLDHYKNGDAQIEADNSPEAIKIKRITMPHNGDWGNVIFMHPPASVTYRLALPSEAVVFHSRIALDPESWSWGGDGATFILAVEIEETGSIVELFHHHIPNEPNQGNWHKVDVPLAKYANQNIFLKLSTEVGPAGDGTGDWAGWEIPRLLWDMPDIDPEKN